MSPALITAITTRQACRRPIAALNEYGPAEAPNELWADFSAANRRADEAYTNLDAWDARAYLTWAKVEK